MTVRPAERGDAAAIAAIYAHWVRESHATFDLEPPTEADWVGRWEEAEANRRPWLVATEAGGGAIGAFAISSSFRTKAAYAATLETTVYVDRAKVGRGLGRPVYEALLGEGTARGFHVAVAGIALPNPGSVALHEALGFEPVGVFREVGHKLGAWRDVQWWQKPLQPSGSTPPHVPSAP